MYIERTVAHSTFRLVVVIDSWTEFAKALSGTHYNRKNKRKKFNTVLLKCRTAFLERARSGFFFDFFFWRERAQERERASEREPSFSLLFPRERTRARC